ncbi:hypothetical protein VPHD528_0217 [Vibrio phage D528]|nr:hypothetical protein MYOV002v2_p0197 [Vibrio phage 144E46.1]
MSVVNIDEAAARLDAATSKLDVATKFMENIAYGGSEDEYPIPNNTSVKLPSVNKLMNDSVKNVHGKIENMGGVDAICSIDFSKINAAYSVTLIHPETSITFENTSNLGGRLVQTLIFLKQGMGANKIKAWPSNVKWASGVAPVLSYKKEQEDVIALTTHDGGVTWYGIFCGGRFE